MNILNTKLVPYSLPLNGKWQSHSLHLTKRQGYLLKIEDDQGHIGYGDCAPLPTHGTETAAEALATLESALPRLARIPDSDCLDRLPDAKNAPAARCALETALLDLMAKQKDIPLHHWLNPKSKSEVKVNTSIGVLDEGSLQRASTAIDKGYSVIKLKIGVSAPQLELRLLTRLCADLPASVRLRLDANRAWDVATTKAFLKGISQIPIESLEEPLARPDIKALAQLQDQTNITLALDETMTDLDREGFSQLHSLRRIILKPMALGGLLPALNLGQRAYKLGIETVVTTTMDSAAGVWAATQLAAALDTESKLCHGVGTCEWLQQDLGEGPEIRNGKIIIPPAPGLGFTPYV